MFHRLHLATIPYFKLSLSHSAPLPGANRASSRSNVLSVFKGAPGGSGRKGIGAKRGYRCRQDARKALWEGELGLSEAVNQNVERVSNLEHAESGQWNSQNKTGNR